MPENDAAFPPLYVYALARRCPTCGAAVGARCEAPQKNRIFDQHNAGRESMGLSAVVPDPLNLMHSRRRDAGQRHLGRDVDAAPWRSDRAPGRRYDSLGELRREPGF
jgi:hypothetical protein